MKKNYLSYSILILSIVLLLVVFTFFSCKKVDPVRPAFTPYYVQHSPSISEQNNTTLLKSDPLVTDTQKESEDDQPVFCYAIYAPKLDLEEVEAQISSFIQQEIASAQLMYNEDAALNLDYTLDVFAHTLGQIKFFGFSCPLSNQKPGDHLIYKAFLYHASSGTVYSFGDIVQEDERETLYQGIDAVVSSQIQTEISSSALSDETLLYALHFTEQGLNFVFPANTFAENQSDELSVLLPYDSISSCISDLFYDLLADYLPARGRQIDPDKPMIALTFDDGPSKYTQFIADLAEQYGGRVTFCVVGNRIDQYRDTLIRVSDAGHEIANHTWEHKKLTSLSYEEAKTQLQKVDDKVYELTGKHLHFIRPTYGSVNDTLKQLSNDLKMPLANWAVDTEDWKSRNADAVYHACMSTVKDGDIVLFHDLYESTYHAIERLIPELTAKGYQLVTLSELVEYSGQSIQYGHIYRDVK